MLDFSYSFMILQFIPEQFFEDETILEFISKNNLLNRNKSYFLNKIDFSRHPKLLDLLVEKSKNNFSETLRSLGQHSKEAYIEKNLEKNKSSIKYAYYKNKKNKTTKIINDIFNALFLILIVRFFFNK